MKFFGDLASKLLWAAVIIVLVFFGWLWAVNNLLSPPAVKIPPVGNNPPAPLPSDSSASPPVPTPVASAPSTNPAAPTPVASAPTDPAAPTPASPTTGEPSPTLVPDSGSPSLVADSNSSPQPALALPDQVTLLVPSKLEKGGVLKIYENNDGHDDPDPIMYSPSKVVKTQGLSLINLPRGQFQEVTGYFLVEETGTYNFTVSPGTDYYLNLSNLRTRIDGVILPNVKGGRFSLERGWHQVSFFANAQRIQAANITWGREAEPLKPLQIWREAQ